TPRLLHRHRVRDDNGRWLGSRLGWRIRSPVAPARRGRAHYRVGLRALDRSTGRGGGQQMSTDGGLVLAVPAKGRLEEQTRTAFSESNLPITRPGGARAYVGTIKNQP